MKKIVVASLLATMLTGVVYAAPITTLDGFVVKAGQVGMKSDKIELRSSGSTGVATLKYADSVSTVPTITIPSSSGADSVALVAATQTLTGKTLTSPTINGATVSGTWAGTPTYSGVVTFSSIPVVPADSFTRAKLIEEPLVVDSIPLASVKEVTGLQLAATASAAKFGLSQTGSFGTPSGVKLVAEDCNNTTNTDACVAYSKVPLSFVAGESMNVQVTVAMTGAGAAAAAPNSNIDVKVYRLAGDGSVGSDLCTTAAQALATSATVRTFACNTTSVVPGDTLIIWVQMVGIEGAAASAIGEIDKLAVAYDIKG